MFICWSLTYYPASMGVGFLVTSIHKYVMIEMKRQDFGLVNWTTNQV